MFAHLRLFCMCTFSLHVYLSVYNLSLFHFSKFCGVSGQEEKTPWESWTEDGFLCEPLFHFTITSSWGQKALIANNQLRKITMVSWTITRKQTSRTPAPEFHERGNNIPWKPDTYMFWTSFSEKCFWSYHVGSLFISLNIVPFYNWALYSHMKLLMEK